MIPGKFCSFAALGAAFLAATTSCKRSVSDSVQVVPVSHTNQQVFQVKGVVLNVKPKEKSVEIRHEAVSNYMPAMTMPFDVKDTNELVGLEPGTPVSFRLTVTDTEGWIDQIHKLGSVATNAAIGATGQAAPSPGQAGIRLVRNVEPLEIGDPLPDYHFTNQLGQAVTTAQFKGQALGITFLFTRCPYPNFCPRMASDFAEVQKQMQATASAPTNWHLLTVSFDPDFDKPEVLKSYADAWHYDPQRWTFATGDIVEVTALGEQLGLVFWHDETGSLSHNLRTVVVDAAGKVQKIYSGNTWTPKEFVDEMDKAAGAK
jgi:protein SCO1/2